MVGEGEMVGWRMAGWRKEDRTRGRLKKTTQGVYMRQRDEETDASSLVCWWRNLACLGLAMETGWASWIAMDVRSVAVGRQATGYIQALMLRLQGPGSRSPSPGSDRRGLR